MVWSNIIVTLGNFFILVMFFTMIYRRFRGSIVKDIVTEKRHKAQLSDHKDGLKDRFKEVEKECEDQDIFCKTLANKVSQWERVFIENNTLEVERREQLKKDLLERHKQQVVLRQAQRVKALVVPEALEQARQELIEQFKKTSAGEGYVTDVITRMSQSIEKVDKHG